MYAVTHINIPFTELMIPLPPSKVQNGSPLLMYKAGFGRSPWKTVMMKKHYLSLMLAYINLEACSFGLCSIPAIFQRLIQRVLNGQNFEICYLYIDHIIAFSETFDQRIDRLSTVLDKLQIANLKISTKKWCNFQKDVSFLGPIVSAADDISTDSGKTKAIKSWLDSKSFSELRSFLCTCTY